MNNFRLGVFDTFSYIIPGLCYIILISLSTNLINFGGLIIEISSLSIYKLLAYFLIAYLIGYTLDGIALKYVTVIMDRVKKGKLKERVLNNFNEANIDANIKDYHFAFIYAFADVMSQNVREKADSLIALSNMSRNLSLGFLLYAITFFFCNIIDFKNINWSSIPLIPFSILVSYLLLSYADRFKCYSHSHLLNCFHIINKFQINKNIK